MIIDGFQKLTLLDFPKEVACIIFTRGCNFRCPYCQNASLIPMTKGKGSFTEEEIFAYLQKRKNVLDGIVISGGEPLLQKGIKDFIVKVKRIGYKVKLDTNGSHPKLLEELLEESLLDYVAMDIKNTFPKYEKTTGKKIPLEPIQKSIELLKQNKVNYEFRTTIVKEYHTIEDLQEICKRIGKESIYFLQNYEDSEGVIDRSLHGFSHEELLKINKVLQEEFPNIKVRALS